MYVTDMSHLAALREVRDRFIDKTNAPTSTLVQVSAFFRPGILVEIEAVAVIPQ
jgi:enamine deaminase RidA (YjgF/YER057c/UK114 family)